MEQQRSVRQQEQQKAMEEAYRRGYHHGFARARELLLHLLSNGMPAGAVLELGRAFEEGVLLPWRMDTGASSAPPIFDVEECQRHLRAEKQRQSGNPP
jgi:hypothetical protein